MLRNMNDENTSKTCKTDKLKEEYLMNDDNDYNNNLNKTNGSGISKNVIAVSHGQNINKKTENISLIIFYLIAAILNAVVVRLTPVVGAVAEAFRTVVQWRVPHEAMG